MIQIMWAVLSTFAREKESPALRQLLSAIWVFLYSDGPIPFCFLNAFEK